MPVRTLKPTYRGVSGRLALKGMRPTSDAASTVQHESTLERDCLMLLDWDWRVVRLEPQPFTLRYEHGGRQHRYTPDMQADFDDGARQWTLVVEVKYRQELRERWVELKPRFKATRAHCRNRGWRFRLMTEREIRTPLLDNVRFLRRYMTLQVDDMSRRALLRSLKALGPCTAQELLAATWDSAEWRAAAIPELWRMVACQEIGAFLEERLTMRSPMLWLP